MVNLTKISGSLPKGLKFWTEMKKSRRHWSDNFRVSNTLLGMGCSARPKIENQPIEAENCRWLTISASKTA